MKKKSPVTLEINVIGTRHPAWVELKRKVLQAAINVFVTWFIKQTLFIYLFFIVHNYYKNEKGGPNAKKQIFNMKNKKYNKGTYLHAFKHLTRIGLRDQTIKLLFMTYIYR